MRSSSCIVLTTALDDQVLVFWGQRSSSRPFLGGYHAMVGGQQEDADRQWGQGLNGASLGCAARELFEECGVLCTTQGVFWTGSPISDVVDMALLRQARDASTRNPEAFYALLQEHSLALDEARYEHIGHWVSPPWYTKRYATDFVRVHLDAHTYQALGLELLGDYVIGEEMIAGQWTSPTDAYAQTMRGDFAVSAPNLALMHAFAHGPAPTEHDPLDQSDCAEHVQALQAQGAYRVPLKSPTLAPATHTNCYVIDGGERFVVVDPGSAQRGELERLFDVIDHRLDAGLVFEAIVLTHHHVDHVVGVPALCKRYEVPVWAHKANVSYLPKIKIARHLEDHDLLDLGPSRTLECLWTPGHAPGHLVLMDRAMGWAWIGDMMASVGSILINPASGNMGDYMHSLDRLLDQPVHMMLPAHGNIITDAPSRVRGYIEHRQAREQKVLEAVRAQPDRGLDVLVQLAYDDAPSRVWPLATLSLRAHTDHLVEQGLIVPSRSGYRAL